MAGSCARSCMCFTSLPGEALFEAHSFFARKKRKQNAFTPNVLHEPVRCHCLPSLQCNGWDLASARNAANGPRRPAVRCTLRLLEFWWHAMLPFSARTVCVQLGRYRPGQEP